MMRRLALSSIAYTPLREMSLSLVRGLMAVSQFDCIIAVETFCRSRFTVVNEPEELLITPERMIDDINAQGWTAGDCDDVALLSAVLLVILGFQVRFRATGIKSDGGYQHVYVEALLGGEWFPVDATIPFRPVPQDNDLIVEV
jgi:transglutaminase-like putative cysteine protease